MPFLDIREVITRRQNLGPRRGANYLRVITFESTRYGTMRGMYRNVTDVTVQAARLCPLDGDIVSVTNERGQEFLVGKRDGHGMYNYCPLATEPHHTLSQFFDRTE